MNEDREDRKQVYEIAYLIAGVPEEKVAAEADAVRKLVADAGASVLVEGAPQPERLAYAMRKKTLSGSYDKYEAANFGWIKFEAGSDKIEALRKNVELLPSVLRSMAVSAFRENTYLGKRSPATASFGKKPFGSAEDRVKAPEHKDAAPATPAVSAIPATIEEMDKSIDEMVKEV